MQKTAVKTKEPQLVQARAQETRARIIEVALQTFSERGFDASNTREIADEAGATHGAIRYHFGTKEQLWKAAIESMFQKLFAELRMDADDMRDNANSEAALKLFLTRYIRYSAKNPHHARIMISESVRGGERLEWMIEKFILPTHVELMSRLRANVSDGILPDLNPVSLFYIIVAMCQLPFVLSREIELIHGVDIHADIGINRHVDAVIGTLLR